MTNFVVELNVRAIRKLLNSKHSKKQTQRTKAFNELVIAVCKIINKDLAQKKYHLDLSDKRLVEELKCSPQQAKRVREKLSAEGITYIPEGQKQTGPGTYPNWLVAMTRENKLSGIVVIHEVDEVSRKKMKPVNQRYNKTYCDIYYPIVDEIFEFKYWSIKDKMITVHMLVNDELARKGLTRDDCRI